MLHEIDLWYKTPGMGKIDRSSVEEFTLDYHSLNHGIKYCIQGEENYFVHGSPISVRTGQIGFVNADVDCHIEVAAGPPVEGFCLDVSPHLLESLAQKAEWGESLTPFSTELPHIAFPLRPSALQTTIGGIVRNRDLMRDSLYADSAMINLASAMLYQLDRIKAESLRIQASRYATRMALWKRMYRVADYMHAHFQESLRMEELAAQASTSLFHFARSFQAVFGCTPFQYLETIRLERAKDFLKVKHLPISTIAYQTGFSDPKYFARRFKRNVGCTPTQFREQHT